MVEDIFHDKDLKPVNRAKIPENDTVAGGKENRKPDVAKPKKSTANSKKKENLPDPDREFMKILKNKASAERRKWPVGETVQKPGSFNPAENYKCWKKYSEWSPSQE